MAFQDTPCTMVLLANPARTSLNELLMSTASPATTPGRRVIAAGIVGNVLEWYDFAVYGYFAPIVSVHFWSAAI